MYPASTPLVVCPDCQRLIEYDVFLESDNTPSAHVDESHRACKHALKAVRLALYPPREKDPLRIRRGRTNRNRGQSVERQLKRRLEELGFVVVDQGGPGRRDGYVEFRGVKYSIEVKSQQHAARPAELRRAYEQAVRQALKDTTPLAFVRSTIGRGRPAQWTVVTADGALPWVAWIEALSAPIPLGAQT